MSNLNVSTIYDKTEEISFESYLKKHDIKDIKSFIKPTKKCLDSCYSYSRMLEAVQMIKYHYLSEDDVVYILSDSGDTDGVTSASMLYSYLKSLRHNWKIKILIHKGKERGLDDDKIYQEIIKNKPHLLIIPDAGSNDKERAEIVFDMGIDIICIDHHNLDTPIEKGILISNKKGDKDVSPFGSGCLVTHKVLQALDSEFNVKYSNKYIDMVALSLISDVMNMSDLQNRTYYHFGLETLDKVNNNFIRQLILDYIGEQPYTQRDISFKIVPKLNAVSRSNDQELKQQVFKAFIGLTDVKEVSKLCGKAHAEQYKIVNDIVKSNIDDIDYNNNLIVVANDTIRKTYAGLIASKLSNGHPIIVGRICDGILLGSFRSPIDVDYALIDNPLIDWKRGHTLASGIQMPSDNVPLLVDYFNNIELPKPTTEVLQSFTISKIPYDIFEDFNKYPEIYGKGIDKPLVHIYNISCKNTDVHILGSKENVIKITKNGIDFMWFNATEEDKKKLIYKETIILEVIGSLNVNEFRGNKTPQIIVEQYDAHIFTIEDYF